MNRYPRTFLQLITFGHVLFGLPLLIAAAYVFIKLDTLNEHYQRAIEHASSSSSLRGELSEDLLHMERSLRRHMVLKDADSLSDYARVRADWRSNIEALARLTPLTAEMVNELTEQLDLEQKAYLAVREGGRIEALDTVLADIRQRSQKSLRDAQGVIDREQRQFLDESNTLRTHLLLSAGLAALFAICCLWAIRSLLARLISRFEKALIRLGKGELQTAIELDGPGDLRWLGRWLEWLRKRLLSLEEARAQVLRHVSHELKTPLAAMHEGASLLSEEVPGPLSAEQRRIVGILQGNSRRLQDLIDGLLRLQQAGHAAERIAHETIRFDQLIAQVVETMHLIAAERNIRFDCELADTTIVAGREPLLTIVHNLLANALKFSPPDSRVKISLNHDNTRAILDVEDQGPGVARDDAARIFEPFFRSSAARHVAGVGLGLAIAREFVLAHRGELKLMTSTAGAHFRVILPLKATYLRQLPNE
ncbi:MAG: histidine kinase [Proteobacteria bacterium]|nr:histidine kinase [Pseudomonadota bacterium]